MRTTAAIYHFTNWEIAQQEESSDLNVSYQGSGNTMVMPNGGSVADANT